MEKIVISGINLVEGGTLSIFKDCLKAAHEHLKDKFEIIALVHKKELFDIPDIKYLEFPSSKKSWLKRIYYEYFGFKKLSKKINPYLWLSMHDMTPNVVAKKRAVYCHNPTPFYKLSSWHEAWLDLKVAFFTIFYKYVYRINIKKNDYVIVQHDWIRQEFQKKYGISNVIVAYPDMNPVSNINAQHHAKDNRVKRLFYPSFPRTFKNFEVIGDAVQILENKNISNYEIIVTIDGTENKYAKYITNKYSHLKSLKFIGLQSRQEVYNLYSQTDCLLFPSKIETWGMPIMEFKAFDKPILISDLPYAKETMGDYNQVVFFNPNHPIELNRYIEKIINNDIQWQDTQQIKIQPPFAHGWQDLFDHLLTSQMPKEKSLGTENDDAHEQKRAIVN